MKFALFIFLIISFNSQANQPEQISTEIATGVPEVIAQAAQSVWSIITIGKNKANAGTGFFISPKTFITNYHVASFFLRTIKVETSVVIQSQKNPKKYHFIKSLVSSSALKDLAVFEIEGEVSNYLPLRQTSSLLLNKNKKEDFTSKKKVFVIGYPQLKFHIMEGLLSYNALFGTFIFIDFEGDLKGASGSPILDEEGRLIGILHSILHPPLPYLSLKWEKISDSYLDEDDTYANIGLFTDTKYINYLNSCENSDIKTCLEKEIKYMDNNCWGEGLSTCLGLKHNYQPILQKYIPYNEDQQLSP